MNIQKNKLNYIQKLVLIFLLFVLALPIFVQPICNLYADDMEEIIYSNVLDDLKKDNAFSEENYPKIENDYSLKFIQIAKSVNNELFVYVYQPLGNSELLATSINISIEENKQNKNFKNYSLTFLNSNQTLFKYKVDKLVVDFNVSYYEFSDIFRPFLKNIDNLSERNETQEIAYPIGKAYTLTKTSIICYDIDYIQIVDKYVGFVRYDGQKRLLLFNNYEHLDSHFIAFSTDKQINNLMEADVFFKTRTKSYRDKSGDTTYGDWLDKYSYLDNTSTGNYVSGKWSYSWKEIQSVGEFIDAEHTKNVYDNGFIAIGQYRSLTTSAMEDLQSKQWVLRFYESPYTMSVSTSTGGLNYDCEEISDVSMLRLKFQTNGVVYNLGVVDNKTSVEPDKEPDNETHYDIKISNKLKTILIIVLLLVALICVIIFAPVIFSWIARIIEFLIKAIIWLITLPIKIIQAICSKNGNKRN